MFTKQFRALRRIAAAVTATMAAFTVAPVTAQDKVKVGVFPVSSSLPYFVALGRGIFKAHNIEPETITLMGGPPNVAALITNQIEVSAVLVMLEGMNANVKKPGVAMYIGVHSQTKVWQMEQFVVRKGFEAKTLKDLKGARLMSAPGPANLNTAKAILAKVGLKEGDYTIDQLDMGQHVNVMTARTFDGGYTLEPNAAGCALTADFIKRRPDVAKRFAQSWAEAIEFINKNPESARKYLAKNTFTPDDVVDTVPMLGYVMTKDISPKQLGEFQKFADFGVEIGVVPEKVDVTKFIQAF